MLFRFKAKNRKKKDLITSRGDYAPVLDPQPGLKHRLSVGRRLLQLAPMVAFLLGGASLMLVHHLFYAHLNGKRIDPGAMELPSLLVNQKNVNLIGTTIAHGARILLAMAIGSTFTQMFWETLRSQSYTIAQIDALVNCGQSPFRTSAFRAATASFALYTVAVAASSTSLIVVLSPGALTNFQRSRPCVVPTVPHQVTASSYNFTNIFNPSTYAFMATILSTSAYLPPFQDDLTSTCGDGFSSCSYNVSFVGPALDCIDITNTTDFSNSALVFCDMEIFEAAFDSEPTGITIFSRDLAKDLVQATNCSAYNATYEVGVYLEETAPATVHIWNVKRDAFPLQSLDTSFINHYAQLGLEQLVGACITTPNGLVARAEASTGSLFTKTTMGNLTLSDTVPHFVTSFIQNAAISLLSGGIEYDLSDNLTTNLQYVNSTCSSPITVYAYNSARLLSAYGVAFVVTVVLVVHGCQLILRNGVERNIYISDLIELALDNNLVRIDKATCTNGRTKIQLSRTDYGQRKLNIIPKPTIDKADGSSKPAEVHFGELTTITRWNILTAAHWKMTLHTLATVCSLLLLHAYYHYLDGKEPSSSLRISNSSGWLLNQAIVSDIGIALAYAGQTFLAVAVATSCSQLFWRTIRLRGHTISRMDSIIRVQASPFSLSIVSALRTSICVPLLALLVASMPLISILAPGSIKITQEYNRLKSCTVLAPRDLSALMIYAPSQDLTDVISILQKVVMAGTYLPPINVCGPDPSTSQCSYDLQFMGPGLDCKEVTVSSNYSTFQTTFPPTDVTDLIFLFQTAATPQTAEDPSLRMFVPTWDVKRSVYQSTNCTGVIRSYSVSISQGDVPIVNVTESRIVSTVSANSSQQLTLAEIYVHNVISLLVSCEIFSFNGTVRSTQMPFSPRGGIGTVELDGSITWNTDLTYALEGFVQNATLSVLSGQVMTLDPGVPDILENVTTTCTYTFTAYEYKPRQLFLTYGVGILVAVLCTIWGSIAIRKNGVEESMDFSRMLRAILNERMYNARDNLDKDTIIKADETPEGALAPVDS